MNKEIKKIGFSPENEEKFLKRLPKDIRRCNLEQELKTQLAEDFGLVEFTLKYKFNSDGKIVDLMSGQEIVELTSRGGVEEEMESIEKIEEGLENNLGQTWIHFSPRNEKLGYPQNCVDFWRVIEEEVVWNRMVVKNDFGEMNRIRQFLSGEEKAENEMKILALPVAVDGFKLAEIFDLFQLNDSKNIVDFEQIKEVVNKYLDEFEENFGKEITENSNLIFRLYSACFNGLKYREKETILSRGELESYMYGIMQEVKVEKSFGCAATTTVGSFGEKIGYYILPGGEVKKGIIPEGEGYVECKQCGCWYKGETCPLCS